MAAPLPAYAKAHPGKAHNRPGKGRPALPGRAPWRNPPPAGHPTQNPLREDMPEDYQGEAQYRASATDGPGYIVTRTNNVSGAVTTCELNGGSHQCAFWITKHAAAPVIQTQCGRKTALVGVDLDFYRCADPNGRTSREIDEAIGNQTLHQVRGRAYFCYIHLQKLIGVVPRQTPTNQGKGLRATRPIPAWSLVACYGMLPILPPGVNDGDRHRYTTMWTDDPANPLNSPLVDTHPGINFPAGVAGLLGGSEVPYQVNNADQPVARFRSKGAPGPVGAGTEKWQAITHARPVRRQQPDQYFDGTCYRDLADYVNDGRIQSIGDRIADPAHAQCVAPLPPPGKGNTQARPRPPAPPAKGTPGAPTFEMPIEQGLTTAQWVDYANGIAIPAPFVPYAPPPPGVPIPAGGGPPGLDNQYCWQPGVMDSVNCAIRRVRFRYFDPYWPRPVVGLTMDDIVAWTPQNEIHERIAIYSLVNVPAGSRPGQGIDLTIDRGNEFWAAQFCPTWGNPTRPCNTFKMH